MNTIANTVQCTHGLCGHMEHTVNILWWLIPTIMVGLYLINLGRTHTDTE
jgi:hypothetical protein